VGGEEDKEESRKGRRREQSISSMGERREVGSSGLDIMCSLNTDTTWKH
jgi:hypothetical protein